MYNPQLETFIRVAEKKSFSKAAEEVHITPTAVIKQINALEASIEVKLFERTHRGLTLTSAGESLYKDAKYIVQYCKDSVIRAQKVMNDQGNIIRIGVSPLNPVQKFMNMWPEIQKNCPNMKLQLIPFENSQENAREILKNLGQNIDVIVGIFDETLLSYRKCAGFELSREPLCCAVSLQHPLACKDRLSFEDLYGEDILLMHRGWSNQVDSLRDEIQEDHNQIHIVDFHGYDMSIFNQCENSNQILIAVEGWAAVHPLLKIVPVDWDYAFSFGILHSHTPSAAVKHFLEAVKSVLKKEV